MDDCWILVVEDSVLIAEAVQFMLMEAGVAAVHVASSARAALDSLVDHHFHAAVLDVDLGGRTSAPVADALAAKGIPFLFYTGGHEVPSGHRRVPVVRKTDFKELAKTLGRLCQQYSPSRRS